jgi:hypothetical protein
MRSHVTQLLTPTPTPPDLRCVRTLRAAVALNASLTTRVDTRAQRMFALLTLLLVAAAAPSAATSRALTATGPGVTFPCLSVQQARVCRCPSIRALEGRGSIMLPRGALLPNSSRACLAPICAAPHPYHT